MSVRLLSVSVSRSEAGEGALTITLRYAYEGKPPSPKKRAGMAKSLLGEVLERLEEDKPVDLGFGEDAVRRVHTDRLEV